MTSWDKSSSKQDSFGSASGPLSMEQDPQRFRQAILAAVRAIKAQQPDAQLHLLYTPELSDPLTLNGDERRDTALIHPPLKANDRAPQREQRPRLITLDCRRVAAYWLETDPGIDDPLFEASITHAYTEYCLQQTRDAELANDERGFSIATVAGWLLSCESATPIAHRFQRFSEQLLFNSPAQWVRWHQPMYLSALWPTLSAEQRRLLLGDATWITFNTLGQLRQYVANAEVDIDPWDNHFVLRRFNEQQTLMLGNVSLVRDLLQQWRAMRCPQRLPQDAEQQLHAQVQAAQALRLEDEAITLYTLTAVQLAPGATQDREWLLLVNSATQSGVPLRDLLMQLSTEFWARWSVEPMMKAADRLEC